MNGFKRYFKRITFALFTLMLTCYSCSDNFESSIPYVYVSINRSLTNLNELSIPSGFVIFPSAGYGGVVVFNTGIPDAEYVAFDLACPYEADNTIVLEVDNSGIGTCPTCGSTYNLWLSGAIESGPTTEPLLPYSAFVSGGYLYVSN
ncbi:Rieske (2Fe-2S) protein [Mangrovibacterium lignilyticum]|uniref:hypothetical protein n=1 Tax=Mangrovibacterium lignilyticum TaxID=2668052 RepID=UPI0013D4DC99|nr:hypothetical protein [Mangrovibacterium lignilyticum]